MPIPAGAWYAASAFAPGLLSALFGNHDNPRKVRQHALSYLDPTLIQKEGESLFQQTLQSPGYNMARSDILGAGQAAQGGIQRHLGQTGLGRSGIGTAMLGAASAAPGIHIGKLSAMAWDSAMQQAQGLARARAGTVAGMPQGQSPTPGLFAGGMNALLPLLFKMMQQQQGGQQNAYGGGGAESFPGAYGDWNKNMAPYWMPGGGY